MAKKLPLEFTKYRPEERPARMMYVRVEALIPVFDRNGGDNSDEIEDSIARTMDAMGSYGQGFVTAQYEIEEDESTATKMLEQRRRDGDISGENS